MRDKISVKEILGGSLSWIQKTNMKRKMAVKNNNYL
jgi:hypothetical protein